MPRERPTMDEEVAERDRADEFLQQHQLQNWMLFAAAAIAGGQDINKAQKTADAMLEAARGRFA